MQTTRRELLRLAAGALALPLLPLRAELAGGGGLTELSAAGAVALMRSGALGAEEYAAALLARAESRRELNAFITLQPERVLAAARAADRRRAAGEIPGALHGLPIPVKDSVLTAEYPTTAGTRVFAEYAPRRDADLVVRLRAAGAIVMGKTNLHELSAGYTSSNEIFGAARNPHDPVRIPGGSSGGSAAAVASGMAPLAVAEDTAGSIRVPAALCGVCGFRPGIGRYPNAGTAPLTPRFDQLGPLARSMEDIVLFDRAVRGGTALVPRPVRGVRIGVPRAHFYAGQSAASARIVEGVLTDLRHAGALLVEADIPEVATLIEQSYVPILFRETWAVLDAWFRSMGVPGGLEQILAEAGALTRAQFHGTLAPDSPGAIPEAAYRAAVDRVQPALIAAVRAYFDAHRLDAMILPATLCVAPPVGIGQEVEIDGRMVSLFDALGRSAILAPACGNPALVLPAGRTAEGLPVGIELQTLTGTDETLLSLGSGVAEVAGG